MESSHFQEIKSRPDRILLETVGKSTNFKQEKKYCESFFSKKEVETHDLIKFSSLGVLFLEIGSPIS